VTLPGRLVVFEGADGTGKSTQAALLSHSLGAFLSREPGGTALGEAVRELILRPSPEPLDPVAEALLMLAARAAHVSSVVRPRLASGQWVVLDRFTASTLAYQGAGRGVDRTELESVCHFAAGGLQPDLQILLTLAPEVAVERLATRRPDRIEGAGQDLWVVVDRAFRDLARADPTRWRVFDGSQPVDRLAAEILRTVVGSLGAPSASPAVLGS
jgi:dTMP kinase